LAEEMKKKKKERRKRRRTGSAVALRVKGDVEEKEKKEK
jgi:hypothetical protein